MAGCSCGLDLIPGPGIPVAKKKKKKIGRRKEIIKIRADINDKENNREVQ